MDTAPERRLSLTELAKREGVNAATAWRWSMRGCRGVKLETFLLGGRRFTTEDLFRRFVAETNETTDVPSSPTAHRQESIRRAKAELDRAGI